MANRKHDWESIRRAYVTSPVPVSLREIANKFDVPLCMVEKHSATEKWVAARKEYQGKIRASSEKRLARDHAKEIADNERKWRNERADELRTAARAVLGRFLSGTPTDVQIGADGIQRRVAPITGRLGDYVRLVEAESLLRFGSHENDATKPANVIVEIRDRPKEPGTNGTNGSANGTA